MKKLFTVFYFLIIASVIVVYSGCGSTASDNGTAVVMGRITDSLSGIGVGSASVTLTGPNYSRTVGADSLGNYIFCQDVAPLRL